MEKFCIVVNLKVPLVAKVCQVQRLLSLRTGSKTCVRFWKSHLTVGSGIIVRNNQLATLQSQFRSVLSKKSSFSVNISGYGFMAGWKGDVFGRSPYVVYLRVQNNPQLQALVKAVERVTNHYSLFYQQPRPYTPHVTLAFGDLTKSGFLRSMIFLREKKFTGTILVDHVSLLRKSSRGKWEECSRFNFRR